MSKEKNRVSSTRKKRKIAIWLYAILATMIFWMAIAVYINMGVVVALEKSPFLYLSVFFVASLITDNKRNLGVYRSWYKDKWSWLIIGITLFILSIFLSFISSFGLFLPKGGTDQNILNNENQIKHNGIIDPENLKIIEEIKEVELYYNKSTGELHAPSVENEIICSWEIWGDHGLDISFTTDTAFIDNNSAEGRVGVNNFLPPRVPIYMRCLSLNTVYNGSIGEYQKSNAEESPGNITVSKFYDGEQGYSLSISTGNRSTCIWTYAGGNAGVPYSEITKAETATEKHTVFNKFLYDFYDFKVTCVDDFGNTYRGIFPENIY